LRLFITSSQGQFGQTTISLTVTDANGLTDTQSFVYEIFTEENFVTATDGYTTDYYGYDVAISNHHAIIGAYYDDDKGSNSGSAYIFKQQGSHWVQSAKLVANNGTANDYFGYAVALSGDYVIIGSYYNDNDVTDQGSAYIFKRHDSSWFQEAYLTASDLFGCEVDISGNYAIIGAKNEDDSF